MLDIVDIARDLILAWSLNSFVKEPKNRAHAHEKSSWTEPTHKLQLILTSLDNSTYQMMNSKTC